MRLCNRMEEQMEAQARDHDRLEAARNFVTHVIKDVYHQQADEDTIRAIAEKVEQATPKLERLS